MDDSTACEAHLLPMLLATEGAMDGAAAGGPCSCISRSCSSLSFFAAESMSVALHTRQRLASEIRPCRVGYRASAAADASARQAAAQKASAMLAPHAGLAQRSRNVHWC